MRHHSPQSGLTLLEALVVLSIFAVLLGLSASSFGTLLQHQRTFQATATFRTLFHYARSSAVTRQRATTVCAVNGQGKCIKTWMDPAEIIVFHDNNSNRRFDQEDEALRRLTWPTHKGRIRWRAALGRPYIVFLSAGNTWQNGTLQYCPRSNDVHHAAALVVNHAGRSYSPGDSNGDGIDEDVNGKNLDCPW